MSHLSDSPTLLKSGREVFSLMTKRVGRTGRGLSRPEEGDLLGLRVLDGEFRSGCWANQKRNLRGHLDQGCIRGCPGRVEFCIWSSLENPKQADYHQRIWLGVVEGVNEVQVPEGLNVNQPFLEGGIQVDRLHLLTHPLLEVDPVAPKDSLFLFVPCPAFQAAP